MAELVTLLEVKGRHQEAAILSKCHAATYHSQGVAQRQHLRDRFRPRWTAE